MPETPIPRLRVLVCPHELVRGGSQLNAIDLAARIRDRGHDVVVYAPRGPLEARIAELGLPFRPAPPMTPRAVRPATIGRLRREVRRFRPDIVHAYESPPAIASAAVSGSTRHRSVVTVLSMDVPDFIPADVPLIVGTADLARSQAGRIGPVRLIEPPVDPDHDQPTDADAARAALGIAPGSFVVAVVGRLSAEHQKARGVAAAIRALDGLGIGPVTLLIAGDGDDADCVRSAAASVSDPALSVRVLGDVADPRPVYAAADVAFGMGGSALRAIAHARPVIVQGADGFWVLLTSASEHRFLSDGFFGHGPSGGPGFGEIVTVLQADPGLRRRLGEYGRSLATERFALDRAATQLEGIYVDALRAPEPPRRAAVAVALLRYARFRGARSHPVAHRLFRIATGRGHG